MPNGKRLCMKRFKGNSYRRVKEVGACVEEQWQISYSEDGMHELLHNLDFSYQKGQIISGKADSEAQVFFKGDF
jgi:transposase